MKQMYKTVVDMLRHFKDRRFFGVLVLCAVLVVSLVARPASAAVVYRDSAVSNNATGATTIVINKPAGTVTNDVMLAVVSVVGGTNVTGVTSPGWTQINTTTSTTLLRSVAFYKVASASEASSYTFTLAPATARKAAGAIVSYSGVDTANPVDVSGVAAYGASPTLTAPAITTTVANTMLVGMYSIASSTTTFTAGSSMSLHASSVGATSGGGATSRAAAAVQDATQAAIGGTLVKNMTTSPANVVNIGHLIALRPAPVISQASYRFFPNTNSTTASTPAIAAIDTSASIGDATPFRLRLNLGVASGGTSMTTTATRQFKLQYALRVGTCDTSFTGESYADITTGTVVRFNNNATPADGAAYVADGVNDPRRSGITAVGQRYQEANPFSSSTAVPANQDGLWDISLTTSGALSGDTYCLRAINNGGSVLNGGYGVIPEFSIPMPTLTQANYQWFTNANSTTPGAPAGTPPVAQDTAVTVATNTPVRLRTRIAVDSASSAASSMNVKVQYAERVGTCDVSFTGESYTDLDNPSVQSQERIAGAAISDSSGVRSWSNPSFVTAADGSFSQASAKENPGLITDNLVTSAHGFSIPVGATIQGIVVKGIYTSETFAAIFYSISPHSIKLVKAGVIVGDNRSSDAGWDFDGLGAYGGPWGGTSQLWGLSWTPGDINDTGFGAAIAAVVTSDTSNLAYADIDSVSIEVYYSSGGPTNPMNYNDNSTPSDGSVITSSGNDPTNALRPVVMQTYQETDPFTNPSAIANGSDGLWDISIVPGPGSEGKTYCFRTVNSDGSPLNAYSQIPQLTIAGTGPTLDQQLRGGQAVVGGIKQPFSW